MRGIRSEHHLIRGAMLSALTHHRGIPTRVTHIAGRHGGRHSSVLRCDDTPQDCVGPEVSSFPDRFAPLIWGATPLDNVMTSVIHYDHRLIEDR